MPLPRIRVAMTGPADFRPRLLKFANAVAPISRRPSLIAADGSPTGAPGGSTAIGDRDFDRLAAGRVHLAYNCRRSSAAARPIAPPAIMFCYAARDEAELPFADRSLRQQTPKENLMSHPVLFPLYHTLTRQHPDRVREVAQQHGFRLHPASGASEIWYKLHGHGYAVVRIDAAGHRARPKPEHAIGGISAGVHGGVPHYHKEWIAADLFTKYLHSYVPQAVRYNDMGQPVTKAMNDGVAKATHIKR